MPKEKVRYSKPTSQQDLERRLEKDNEAETLLTGVNPAEQDHLVSDGYVGVDPVYQNHANDTDKPRASEDGAEKKAEEAFVASLTATVSESEDDEDDEDDDDLEPVTTSTPATPVPTQNNA